MPRTKRTNDAQDNTEQNDEVDNNEVSDNTGPVSGSYNNVAHDKAIRQNNAHNIGESNHFDPDFDYSDDELNQDEDDITMLPRVIPNHTGQVFNAYVVREAFQGEKVMSPEGQIPGARFALPGEKVYGPDRNKGSHIVGTGPALNAEGVDPTTHAPLVGDEGKDEQQSFNSTVGDPVNSEQQDNLPPPSVE